jgi:hypothetical protein
MKVHRVLDLMLMVLRSWGNQVAVELTLMVMVVLFIQVVGQAVLMLFPH